MDILELITKIGFGHFIMLRAHHGPWFAYRFSPRSWLKQPLKTILVKKRHPNKNPTSKTLFEPLLGGRFVVKRRIRGPDFVERELQNALHFVDSGPLCREKNTSPLLNG